MIAAVHPATNHKRRRLDSQGATFVSTGSIIMNVFGTLLLTSRRPLVFNPCPTLLLLLATQPVPVYAREQPLGAVIFEIFSRCVSWQKACWIFLTQNTIAMQFTMFFMKLCEERNIYCDASYQVLALGMKTLSLKFRSSPSGDNIIILQRKQLLGCVLWHTWQSSSVDSLHMSGEIQQISR